MEDLPIAGQGTGCPRIVKPISPGLWRSAGTAHWPGQLCGGDDLTPGGIWGWPGLDELMALLESKEFCGAGSQTGDGGMAPAATPYPYLP